MTVDIRPPDHDEPAVRSPELRRFVDAARAAPTPVLRVTPEAVFAGFEARKRGQKRLALGLALAAAAAIALVSARPWKALSRPVPIEPVASNMVEQSPDPVPALAEVVRVAAVEGPAPAVRGAWKVELAPGRYDIEVGAHAGPEVLRVTTPDGALEIAHGVVHVVIAGARTEAALRTGVATWVTPDGARTPLDIAEADEPIDLALGPAELARRADKQLAAGRRDAAAATLRRLVVGHPESPQARTALLDLARLHRDRGRTDEARCAYALYLERYPAKAQLAGEVEAALARLGPGKPCNGLRPR